MIAELFNIVYDKREKRIRGSFIQLITLSILFSSYILILFLIWYAAYVLKQPVAEMSSLILGLFTSLAAVQSYNFSVYYQHRNKKSNNEAVQ